MTRLKRAIGLGVVLLGSAIAAQSALGQNSPPSPVLPSAQPANSVQPTIGSRPAEQLDQLAYFQGTWRCRVREADAPATTFFAEFTWTITRELNRYWFLGTVVAPDKTDLARDTLGFNTLTGKFGRTILTADGGFYNLLSEGWKDRTFTWEGSALDMPQRTKRSLREVIEQKTDSRFEATYYTLEPTSKTWKPDTREICEKQSRPSKR